MNSVLPSSHVGVKINEWYKMIRQFSISDAEILKEEVTQKIERMEEDQDLLIYFQLMCFRHQLMLDYLEPKNKYGDRPTIKELLEKIEAPQKKLTGLLKYYSLFFRGMYEFDQKEYVEAINYYRKAEKELGYVTDEIEKAEFHFKVAEAYYIMKQTHVSMHHILQALAVYDTHTLYQIRKIQSLFVIAGNYDDFKCYDKAIPHLKNALQIADKIYNKRMMIIANLNIGLSYDRAGNYIEAALYFKEALRLIGEKESDLFTKVYFGLCCALFKSGHIMDGVPVLEKGIEYLDKNPNELYRQLFDFLDALYVQGIYETKILEVLEYLDSKKLYAYIEECVKCVAVEYEKANDHLKASRYFKAVLETQTKIQRGDCLYDY
ncbi:tetratricopeptide repeat protein [Bacillus inaquosorum]|uniref:response regulator aspartate phosphatase n=2 Tax=Bacillus inaquosorum TaxID=483913 RepID=UPI00227F7FEC|nr:tetratricopeptide repeat protein [Bacillus inaquosorum]MCY9379414.1 tetratricopeptide repeat protein [Bacillus inaquosorum]